MGKRSTKFYRKNEEEVMNRLGFNPTKNSGAGWVEKEDGQSEHCICQLKSTDSLSMSIKQKDLQTLEYNATVSHKLPVFAIQFLNTGETWVLIKPSDLEHIQGVMRGDEISKDYDKNIVLDIDIDCDRVYNSKEVSSKHVRRTLSARERYFEQRQKEKEEQELFFKQKQKERRANVRKKV